MSEAARKTIRLDKWLWFARFFKTRTLSAKVVAAGRVRVNGTKVSKPSVLIGEGDTLTFSKDQIVRVIRLLDIGTRRGPAPEAQGLYNDMSPPVETGDAPFFLARKGARPTKKDRRALDKLGVFPFD